MKVQWSLILGLIFALIVAVFAVYNVTSVPVNFVFSQLQFPLVLVILGSALAGAVISGSFAAVRTLALNRRIKELERQLAEKEVQISNKEEERAFAVNQLSSAEATPVDEVPAAAVEKAPRM